MAKTNTEIIEAALVRLAAEYIDEGKAAQAVAFVRDRLAAGAYEALAGPALCESVTEDFQQVTDDKHLRLLWSDEPQELGGTGGDEGAEDSAEDSGEDKAFFAELARAENQGIRRVERLAGDIGYIDTTLVAEPSDAAPMICAAMTIVANTKALILDLRGNRGGSTYGMAYWCSYFFPDSDSVHLTDIYRRTTGRTQQFWTLSYVPGERYLDRPVYVLIGPVTFSGAEDLAYNLKACGRAVLVGESTRGGAHPTGYYPLTEHITVTVPYGRSINPITGGNWEGVGVAPDLAVPADEAFEAAYQDAMKKVADPQVEES